MFGVGKVALGGKLLAAGLVVFVQCRLLLHLAKGQKAKNCQENCQHNIKQNAVHHCLPCRLNRSPYRQRRMPTQSAIPFVSMNATARHAAPAMPSTSDQYLASALSRMRLWKASPHVRKKASKRFIFPSLPRYPFAGHPSNHSFPSPSPQLHSLCASHWVTTRRLIFNEPWGWAVGPFPSR